MQKAATFVHPACSAIRVGRAHSHAADSRQARAETARRRALDRARGGPHPPRIAASRLSSKSVRLGRAASAARVVAAAVFASDNPRHVGSRARGARRRRAGSRQGRSLRSRRPPAERLHGRDLPRQRGDPAGAHRLRRPPRRHGRPAHRAHRRHRLHAGARLHRAPRASVESGDPGRARAPRLAARHHVDLRRHPDRVRARRALGLRARRRRAGAGPAEVLLADQTPRADEGDRRGAALPRRGDRAHARQPVVGGHRRGHALARRRRGAPRLARAAGARPLDGQADRRAYRGRWTGEARGHRRRRHHVGSRADHRAGGARPRAPRVRAHAEAVVAAARPSRAARSLREVGRGRPAHAHHRRKHAGVHRRARVRRQPRATRHRGGRLARGRVPDGHAQPGELLRQGPGPRRHRAGPIRRRADALGSPGATARRGDRPRAPRGARRSAARADRRAAVAAHLHRPLHAAATGGGA